MTPNGQIAIVTGGGSGLGEATARALATKGAKIAILDIGIDRAAKV
ncbi:SDR family NAD(P)-dependent oxidoreductase, partial [Mesorhizobium sp.]